MAIARASRIAPCPIGLWVFKIIVAAAFIMFGAFKLSGAPMMAKEFGTIGLGQGFGYFTGMVEVGGALLLLFPATFRFGAVALLAVSMGAFFTQAFVLHGDVIHTMVLIAITGLMAGLALRWYVKAPWIDFSLSFTLHIGDNTMYKNVFLAIGNPMRKSFTSLWQTSRSLGQKKDRKTLLCGHYGPALLTLFCFLLSLPLKCTGHVKYESRP